MKARFRSTAILLVSFFAGGVAYAAGKYDPGASDTEIKIGHTNPYSGAASAYSSIGKAQAAYFKMINDNGGINGRRVKFISLDDGYSPPRTVEQVRKLVEQEQVLLIFQPLGTPSNTAVHRYLNDQKVPQLFVASGATKWGDHAGFPWTMGFQPSYQSEARAYANYILKHHPNGKIGILYQNDDYGKDYLRGFKEGLGDKASKMIVKEVSYEVSEPTVDSQVIMLKGSGADVFFNVTTPKFAAQSIRKAAQIGWKPVHVLNVVSANIENVIKPAGVENAKDIITAQYLKDATDPQWQKDKDFQEWHAWMKKYNPGVHTNDVFYVFGYTTAYTLAQVLKQSGDNLTRQNVMKQAASLKNLQAPMMLPGIRINTGPTDYFPIEEVRLAKFDGEKFAAFGDIVGGGRK